MEAVLFIHFSCSVLMKHMLCHKTESNKCEMGSERDEKGTDRQTEKGREIENNAFSLFSPLSYVIKSSMSTLLCKALRSIPGVSLSVCDQNNIISFYTQAPA